MGRKTPSGTESLFHEEPISDTMHEKEPMTAVRVRAERLAVLEFMKGQLQKAEFEQNESLATTCRRIIRNYEELLAQG